jgi:hypothetical protein
VNAPSAAQGGQIGHASGESYPSSNDLRVHFELGDNADAGFAVIHWPSGVVGKINQPAADRIYSITEGQGIRNSFYPAGIKVASTALQP